jgi:hypothetical protein
VHLLLEVSREPEKAYVRGKCFLLVPQMKFVGAKLNTLPAVAASSAPAHGRKFPLDDAGDLK